MCLFWAKNNFDGLFWNKEEGDGRTLLPWQSMISGFSAACLGPVATGPFDVIKVLASLQARNAFSVPAVGPCCCTGEIVVHVYAVWLPLHVSHPCLHLAS